MMMYHNIQKYLLTFNLLASIKSIYHDEIENLYLKEVINFYNSNTIEEWLYLASCRFYKHCD